MVSHLYITNTVTNCILQSFGNHEFDNGVDGLVTFLTGLTFPVVAANLDASGEARLKDLFVPSVVLEVGGQKIGVVGYISPDTPELAGPGNPPLYLCHCKAPVK